MLLAISLFATSRRSPLSIKIIYKVHSCEKSNIIPFDDNQHVWLSIIKDKPSEFLRVVCCQSHLYSTKLFLPIENSNYQHNQPFSTSPPQLSIEYQSQQKRRFGWVMMFYCTCFCLGLLTRILQLPWCPRSKRTDPLSLLLKNLKAKRAYPGKSFPFTNAFTSFKEVIL